MLLGETIRDARIASGLSQQRAADLAGVSNTQWCRYETGISVPPKDKRERVFSCIGLDVDDVECEFGL